MVRSSARLTLLDPRVKDIVVPMESPDQLRMTQEDAQGESPAADGPPLNTPPAASLTGGAGASTAAVRYPCIQVCDPAHMLVDGEIRVADVGAPLNISSYDR